ncbi:MAG TPA: CpsD/CapB family tyrosine-protein kinase [Pyrinomonadaceae bacterium]|nr:CpsD/CapB family tyrosine-protein kinase [Pyrinomonadaceae bacterium]
MPQEPDELSIAESERADLTTSDNAPSGMLAMTDLRIGAPRLEQVSTRTANGRNEVNGDSLLAVGVSAVPTVEESLSKIPEFTINVERVNTRLVSITQPRSPYCEEYRNLRTQILHRSKKRKLQAIVVASVGPSEGKSVTALNLSWLFSQADGVRALLIDSDLRRPAIANYLGIESKTGLSEVLTGGASLIDSIVRLKPSGLYLLPGGTARSDVAELLSGPRFAEILKEARNYFDYIIIDAPPLGIFTDASLLINLSDGAMLVIRANHTRYKDVDRVLDSLPRERMLGTILNQSEGPLMDESYYRYGLYDRNDPIRA